MFGDVIVQDLAAAMFQNHEHEQNSQPDRRHREEVSRHDLVQVVL
jgi:hypothetical protein